MIANLTFDLDQPDDRMAHMRCVKATDMAIALWEIANTFQNMEREFEYTDEQLAALERMRDRIICVMDVNGINLDELIQ